MLYVRLNMRALFIISLFFVLSSCERSVENTVDSGSEAQAKELDKAMIRFISFYGTDDSIGIELNGDRAFLRKKDSAPNRERFEIPYDDGLRLIETFYDISDIEKFRGTESDDRQTSVHHLISVYDENPEYYSEEWIDYVIPKAIVHNYPEIHKWFTDIQDAMKLTLPNKTLHPTADQL